MISTDLVNTIIQAGTGGAGLIFAAYGIIIASSDKLKEFKQSRIREIKKKVDSHKTGTELKEIGEELEEAESTPLYFSRIVLAIFLLYIVSVILGLMHMNSSNIAQSNLGYAAMISFGLATVLFGMMGLSVLNDIVNFMKDFLTIKEEESKGKKKDGKK